MKSKFSNKRLDLIKADFEAKRAQDSLFIDSIQSQINSLLKRKYLYTANFAINHSDNEIAPYLVLTELYDANINLLDTINNSLSPKVKKSVYGMKLNGFIEKIIEAKYTHKKFNFLNFTIIYPVLLRSCVH